MITPHINAKKKDFSDIVLMSGDPVRIKYISKRYLKNCTEITNTRFMLGYTGFYKNRKISLMGHGMGVPSSIIYVTELVKKFGVKKIIRIGTCGTFCKTVKLRDIIISLGACTDSRVNRIKFKDNDFCAIADFFLVQKAFHVAKNLNIFCHIGNIFTTDLFYGNNIDFFNLLQRYKILGIDMETNGIYSTAIECGVSALSICTVSDDIINKKMSTIKEREESLTKMIKIALETSLLI